MDVSKLVSINGKSGLYRLVGQLKNGVIVESLEDGKRIPAHSSSQISALEDISVYCTDGDKPFSEVLDELFKYQEGKEIAVDVNDNDALKKWFLAAVPNYDKERVYVSDIKKTVKWYNAMFASGLLKQEEKKEEKKTKTKKVTDEETPKKEAVKAKSKPKAAAPKTGAKPVKSKAKSTIAKSANRGK